MLRKLFGTLFEKLILDYSCVMEPLIVHFRHTKGFSAVTHVTTMGGVMQQFMGNCRYRTLDHDGDRCLSISLHSHWMSEYSFWPCSANWTCLYYVATACKYLMLPRHEDLMLSAHRSRSGSRLDLSYQQEFQCHVNCQVLGFQKMLELK